MRVEENYSSLLKGDGINSLPRPSVSRGDNISRIKTPVGGAIDTDVNNRGKQIDTSMIDQNELPIGIIDEESKLDGSDETEDFTLLFEKKRKIREHKKI